MHGACRTVEADIIMAEERGPSKAEVALLRMPKTQLAKQLMKAVLDEDFWSMNLQLHDTPDGPSA